MSTERSNIEVFFSARGVEAVEAAFRRLAAAQAAANARGGPGGPSGGRNQTTSLRQLIGIRKQENVAPGFLGMGRSLLGTFSTLRRIGGSAISAITGGLKTLGSGALTVVRNLGGIVPVARFGTQAVGGLVGFMERAVTQAAALGVAAYGAGRAFGSIYDSTAELTSVVLALRAVNNEVTQANGQARALPRFAASGGNPATGLVYPNTFGLVDESSGGKNGARKAAADLEFLNKVSHAHGISIRELGKDYATLKASSIGSAVSMRDVAGVTEAIADAALVLGRTPAEVHRANIALGQMASKGQVYAEELKGQLAEAIPGALPIAAKAYGVTVAQFNKMVKDGTVDAATFFRKFSRQLKEEYGDAAKSAADTTRVAAGQLANAWFNAKVVIGSGDLDNMFKRILKSATQLLETFTNNGNFARFGSSLAEAIDPLVSRFEGAVRSGTAFQKVLNFLVGATRVVVSAINVTIDVVGSFAAAFRNMYGVIEQYGFKIPSIGNVLRGLVDTFRAVTAAISTRQLSGNGLVDFFASLYVLVESVVYALAKMTGIDLGRGFRSANGVLESMAQYMAQVAAAFFSIADGSVNPVLNRTGAGILQYMIDARKGLKTFLADLKIARGLLTGKDAPVSADLGLKRLFAQRDKILDLINGRKNTAKLESDGTVLVGKDELKFLFQARDVILGIFRILYENRSAFIAIFAGAIDTIKGALAVFKRFLPVLDAIATSAGFKSFATMFGYVRGMALGFVLLGIALGPIFAILRPIYAVFKGIGIVSKALAVTLGISSGELILIVGGLLLAAYAIGMVAKNWDLFKDNFFPAFKGLRSFLLDLLADLVHMVAVDFAKIPIIGKTLARRAFDNETKYRIMSDAAASQSAQELTANSKARAERNGGVDPYANGPKPLFDFTLKDVLGKVGLSPDMGGQLGKAVGIPELPSDDGNETLGSIDATLKDIRAQNDNTPQTDLASLQRQLDELKQQDASTGGGMQPLIVPFPNGRSITLYGPANDARDFAALAEQYSDPRATQAPAWAGN